MKIIKKKYIGKLTLILSIFILLFLILFKDKLKVCLCTVAKLENNYIKEFIEHYKQYNLDKIYLYDNNDINGENFNFLSNYTKTNFLEIINYRGIKQPQLKIYRKCYLNNYKKYNWILFYDIDEFINLTQYSDIHDFLSQKKFTKCKSIYLNWRIHTDNDLFFYDNRSLVERFPRFINDRNYCIGKSIMRGNIENLHITGCHILDPYKERCDGFGNIIKTQSFHCKVPDFKYNYIDHYQFKSTQEFVDKINIRGDCQFKQGSKIIYKKILEYFRFNQLTKQKIKYISNRTGLNLTFIETKFSIDSRNPKIY